MKAARTLTLLALGCVVYVFGCEQLAGIEERKFVEGGAGAPNMQDAGGPEPPNALCEEYCSKVLEGCTGTHAVYSGLATCYGVCALLPEGDELEPVGNTIQCRLTQAQNAIDTREPADHCEAAGPGGGDTCGDNCEGYCYLLERACEDDFDAVADCEDKCRGLRDVGSLDVVADHEGDSVQCRLVHVSSASVDPEGHCGHARFAPTLWCLDAPDDSPDCEEYCNLVEIGCTDDLAQYESHDQCLSICEALEPGEIQDTVENTVGCRKYHSYSSLAVPETHCYHAGPLGDGHCGHDEPDEDFKSNCESYCQILEAACGDDFDDAFANQDDCQSDCASKPDSFLADADSEYTVTAEGIEKNTLQCRMFHLARAFEDDSECAAAMGEAPCD